MSKLPYVNLGCGSQFVSNWINIDFLSNSPDVVAHNLLNGIPLKSNSAEVVYHSHVLEHFPKDKAIEFIAECFRVLKPGGVLRIAIPDIHQIISHYVRITNAFNKSPEDGKLWAEYDWIMLELYDQTVRNSTGGDMAKYLTSGHIVNKEFIIERCGDEVKDIMDFPERYSFFNAQVSKKRYSFGKELYRLLRYSKRKERLIRILLGKEYRCLQMGRFRVGGEIHQWMYDQYSLNRLLRRVGFINFIVTTAFESRIKDWALFNLDGKDGIVRKPDSLFVEVIKPVH